MFSDTPAAAAMRAIIEWSDEPIPPPDQTRAVNRDQCERAITSCWNRPDTVDDVAIQRFAARIERLREVLRSVNSIDFSADVPTYDGVELSSGEIDMLEFYRQDALEILLLIETLRRDLLSGREAEESATMVRNLDGRLHITPVNGRLSTAMHVDSDVVMFPCCEASSEGRRVTCSR